MQKIPLAELLQQITTELRRAHEAAEWRGNAVMRFQECELEFAIEAEAKAEGGFHVWVLDLGGGGSRTEANTIKIKYAALEGVPTVALVESVAGRDKAPQRQGHTRKKP
ncbi:MAG: hypothetical protein JO250_12090 [Armatimonadetes bacterium]|nr:hypothetical protein [Armatimonadota bacterium]